MLGKQRVYKQTGKGKSLAKHSKKHIYNCHGIKSSEMLLLKVRVFQRSGLLKACVCWWTGQNARELVDDHGIFFNGDNRDSNTVKRFTLFTSGIWWWSVLCWGRNSQGSFIPSISNAASYHSNVWNPVSLIWCKQVVFPNQIWQNVWWWPFF